MDTAEALDPRNSGTRVAAMDQVDMAEKMAELGTAPAKQKLYEAQAREAGAKADASELELRQSQQAMRAMQGGTTEQADPIARLEALGTALTNAGALNKGAAILEKTAAIRSSQQARLTAQATQQRLQSQQQAQALTQAANLYRGVDSPESWDEANTRWKLLHNGQDSPFAHLDYEPGLPQKLADASLSQKEKLEVANKERDDKARDANYKSQDQLRRAKVAQAQAAIDAIKQRMDIVKKNGGAGAPELAELRKSQDQLNRVKLAANAGLTSENPIETVPALASRTPGKYYKTPKGALLWTQRGWAPPGTVMPATIGQNYKAAAGNMAQGLSDLFDVGNTDGNE